MLLNRNFNDNRIILMLHVTQITAQRKISLIRFVRLASIEAKPFKDWYVLQIFRKKGRLKIVEREHLLAGVSYVL